MSMEGSSTPRSTSLRVESISHSVKGDYVEEREREREGEDEREKERKGEGEERERKRKRGRE